MAKTKIPNTIAATVNLPEIKAAGGLVYNDRFHILLIFKRGKWDLPKGRLEPRANAMETALREISEETGLDKAKLSPKGKLPQTFHTTRHEKIKYLKKTSWYLVHYRGDDSAVVPQFREGIIECRWVHLPDLDKYRSLLLPRIEYVIDFWLQNLAYAPRK
ncbi:MAG: NUDIX domain-containing protein [bacterium]|nr:NUDIX domain-containing protein [bacterium]